MRRPRQTGARRQLCLKSVSEKLRRLWAAYCVGQCEAGRHHRTNPRVLLAEEAVLGRSRAAGSALWAVSWRDGYLTESLRQPFVVENRAGATGNIAAQAVVGSQPDGYRLLVVTTASDYASSFRRPERCCARCEAGAMVNLVAVHPANMLAKFIAPVIEKSGIKASL